MQIRPVLKPVFQKFTIMAAVGILCLGLVPQDSFAHWRPHGTTSPPSRPSGTRPPSRPVRPVRPVSLQQLQQRFQQRGIKPTPETLERLGELDERVLGVIDRLSGNYSNLTDEQRAIADGWLNNILDSSGQIQEILDDAESRNNNAWIVDNIELAFSITKSGVIVVALVANPAAVPVLVLIEQASTVGDNVGAGIGELSAPMVTGSFDLEHFQIGAENATVEVAIRLAAGKVAKYIVPGGFIRPNMTITAIKESVLKSVSRTAIKEVTSAAINHDSNDGNAIIRPQTYTENFTLTQEQIEKYIPVQSSEENFTLSHVQTSGEDFTLSPEQLGQTANSDDPVSQFIEGHFNEQAEAANPEMTNAIQGYLDTGEVTPPPQPAPSAQSVKGNSTTAPESFDNLFVTPRPQVSGARP